VREKKHPKDVTVGVPASTAAQVAAFGIDVVTIGTVAGVAAVWSGSVAFTVVAASQVAFLLGLWEARTGLTVGNAALRQRTIMDQSPDSPGFGPVLVRGMLLGLGLALFVVGALVIVLSSQADQVRRQTFVDRHLGLMVVSMPRKSTTTPVAQAPRMPVLAPVPHHEPRPPVPLVPPAGAVPMAAPHAAPPTTALPAVPPVPAVPPTAAMPVASAMPAVPPSLAPAAPPTLAVPIASAMSAAPAVPAVPPSLVPAAPPTVAVPVLPVAPAASAALPVVPRPAAPPGVVLVLVLDTGQRHQVTQGATVVLGRGPTIVAPGDQAVVLHDEEGTVSKNHVRVEHGSDGVWLTDLGSTNGTDLLDGPAPPRTLPPGVRTRLGEGVRVRMGNRVLTVSRTVQGAGP